MIVRSQKFYSERFPRRAGVIPYTIRDQRLYFLLGIDRRTRELTDFGGGVKITETMVKGALREFDEESCKMFGNSITEEHLTESPAVTNHDRNIAIFFVNIDSKWLDDAEIEFVNKQKELGDMKKHNELIGVKWVSQENFRLIAFNRKSQCMWKRIQNILCWNTSWCELHLTLLCPELNSAITNSWRCVSKGLKTRYAESIIVS